jgi:signal transduction histidine kinase
MHIATADILDLVIGALEFGLALIVLGHVWRFRRGFPWLIALIAFFLLRGADRVSIGMRVNESTELGYLLDALELAALILLVLGIERIARALERALDRAIAREHEYDRAIRDYRRLVRHRIANPLTAILGGVRTLQGRPTFVQSSETNSSMQSISPRTSSNRSPSSPMRRSVPRSEIFDHSPALRGCDQGRERACTGGAPSSRCDRRAPHTPHQKLLARTT